MKRFAKKPIRTKTVYDPKNPAPKKSMGQNFLKSVGALRKIQTAATVQPPGVILEIGPGTGALTEYLIPICKKLVAVEKDDTLYVLLQEKFAKEVENGVLELIHGDILEFDPAIMRSCGTTYNLVANIPYNITGAIIQKFMESETQPEMMVLLVQREVAERIVAQSGRESILSICVKIYGTPSYVSTVKAGSFHPVPRVDSAILKIDRISRNVFINSEHEDLFFTLVKTGFAHPRKLVIGNLAQTFDRAMIAECFTACGLSDKLRAENLSVKDWSELSRIVYNAIYGI